jgi:hypothetical protein
MLLFYKKSVDNRKEPEPQFVVSAPAPGDYLISAPWLSAPSPQHWFCLCQNF